MANYSTSAINLKSYNLGEADKIIVMYSRDHGIIKCVAKGVKKPTSKLGGRIQTLVANKLLMAKGKNLDIICQAEMIDNFRPIQKDISKLTYSIYCAELINSFGVENDSHSEKIYDIFFESLKNIALATNNDEILWTVIRFKLKLMQEIGYAVELRTCVKCNKEINNDLYAFCSYSGGIICEECNNQGAKNHAVEFNIVKLYKDISKFDFPECNNENNKLMLNNLILSYSFNILKEYISLRLHKKLKTIELIECLC